ncbi:MAG: aminotransferase class V-fold PLP-dependent enzyme [Candidatus Dormibacteraeota bacterium]|nr:aminotransferase class V-fold PLP-dependent enzyme [Candidatus Dormibacteraeota bacterium]
MTNPESGAPPYDIAALRAQFPVTASHAYFDHATFGPPPRAFVVAATACLRELSEAARLPVPWSAAVDRVRGDAARLFNCVADDVAFTKSTAEAMSLVALGLDWRQGDEVVVYEEQFPAGVLPWLNLAHLGVRVRFVRDRGRHRFDAAEVEELIGERTRVVCLELVNFANGLRVPVEAVAKACRDRGAWLLVDATQAAGVLKLDVARLGCHLLAAHGYKFLASGYGVAPCYVHPELRSRLRVPEPGWKSRPDLSDELSITGYDRVEYAEAARRFEPSVPDVIAIVGMGASLELFLGLGLAAVEAWALRLAALAAEAVQERGFRVVSSRREGERSAILSVERAGVDPRELEAGLRAAGAVVAVREGRLRLSFHCYNDEADLDRLLAALAPWDARSR